jgi:CRP-like cAMP-binding protein
MTDYSKLKAHIQKRQPLTDKEAEDFCLNFKMVHVKKRQFIVQPEFIAKNRFFVTEGSFRAYVIVDEGQEHTIQFAIDDWWITDYNSYIFQQPASMFVMALEDSVVFQISYEAELELKKLKHVYESFFRVLAERTAAHMARRVILNLTKTAEQRFEYVQQTYPDIVSRVPQYALASYLGITTEYLSKLRNRRVSSKKLI